MDRARLSARDCVIVVKRDDDVWDASCFDERCGLGLHSLDDDNGNPADNGYPSEASARRAAARHRAELKQLIDAEERCPTCDQRIRGVP